MAARVITSVEEWKQAVGEELGIGDWVEITQDRVNQFAECTGDHQWIHVDVERAKASPFGGTIAHGYLTLSLAGMLGRGGERKIEVQVPSRMGINYGLNKVRFTAPVKVGKRVRSRRKIVAVEEVAPKVIQVTTQVTVEIEGEDKPAMVAETLARTYLQ